MYLPDLLARFTGRNSSERLWAEDKQRCQHREREGFQEGDAISENILGFGCLNYCEKPSWLSGSKYSIENTAYRLLQQKKK